MNEKEAARVDVDKFLDYAKSEKAKGKSAKKIAQSLGLSTTKYKEFLRRAKTFKRVEAT